MRNYLMRIMERFEIAYARPTNKGVWLVPQALPDEQPAGVESLGLADSATRLRYSDAALPEGLVARAIVRLHAFADPGARPSRLTICWSWYSACPACERALRRPLWNSPHRDF